MPAWPVGLGGVAKPRGGTRLVAVPEGAHQALRLVVEKPEGPPSGLKPDA